MKRKPGFYWVRVTKYGRAYPNPVPAEYCKDPWKHLYWKILGWDTARFRDDELQVLSKRLIPPQGSPIPESTSTVDVQRGEE